MPGKAHSRATRLGAALLARLAGVDAAAAAFRVDPRTIRGWLGQGEVPADEWTAIRDVLRARGAEMAAKGETRGLVALLTAAGISDRNVRYGELIARREARREAEQEPPPLDPIPAAIAELTDEQTALVAAELRLAIDVASRRKEQPPEQSEEEYTAAFLAYVAEVAALSPEEVAARTATAYAEEDERQAAEDAIFRAELAELQASREQRRPDLAPQAAQDAPERPPRLEVVRRDDAPDALDAWQPWYRIEQ